MLNPLAVGVTLGGQFLDVIAPRPKPRAGSPVEPSLLSQRTVTRTARGAAVGEFGGRPVGGGVRLRRV